MVHGDSKEGHAKTIIGNVIGEAKEGHAREVELNVTKSKDGQS